MTKIIAEICQNHNGSRERLAEMVKAAAENGADFVKMQTIYSADVTKRTRFEDGVVDESGKQIVIKRPYQAEMERLSNLDLTIDDHKFFIDACDKAGVIPMTTIFARHRIKETGALPWTGKWAKVASYDCASIPLIKELAEHFDNFIISTGATYDNEIKATAQLMKELGKNFAFLHCVTSYPNTVEMGHLKKMEWLRQFTPHVGWSDHSLIERDGISMSKVAIMLGADYVERHFTIVDAKETKDGLVSFTPALLKELSEFRNLPKDEQLSLIEKERPDWKVMLGEETRDMTHTELLNRDYYRGRFASPIQNQRSAEEDQWIYNWEDRLT